MRTVSKGTNIPFWAATISSTNPSLPASTRPVPLPRFDRPDSVPVDVEIAVDQGDGVLEDPVPVNVGITLTESLAMFPAASVSGFYLAHPDAHDFAVGRLGRDQVADYARREGMPLHEAERWLAPILGYEPEGARG